MTFGDWGFTSCVGRMTRGFIVRCTLYYLYLLVQLDMCITVFFLSL
jgi:hypothetical protein